MTTIATGSSLNVVHAQPLQTAAPPPRRDDHAVEGHREKPPAPPRQGQTLNVLA